MSGLMSVRDLFFCCCCFGLMLCELLFYLCIWFAKATIQLDRLLWLHLINWHTNSIRNNWKGWRRQARRVHVNETKRIMKTHRLIQCNPWILKWHIWWRQQWHFGALFLFFRSDYFFVFFLFIKKSLFISFSLNSTPFLIVRMLSQMQTHWLHLLGYDNRMAIVL